MAAAAEMCDFVGVPRVSAKYKENFVVALGL